MRKQKNKTKKQKNKYIEKNKQEDGIYESTEMGVCPVCGSSDLCYYDDWSNNDTYYNPFTCENCKSRGEEEYTLDPDCIRAAPPTEGDE